MIKEGLAELPRVNFGEIDRHLRKVAMSFARNVIFSDKLSLWNARPPLSSPRSLFTIAHDRLLLLSRRDDDDDDDDDDEGRLTGVC